jgi:hypothetical protein
MENEYLLNFFEIIKETMGRREDRENYFSELRKYSGKTGGLLELKLDLWNEKPYFDKKLGFFSVSSLAIATFSMLKPSDRFMQDYVEEKRDLTRNLKELFGCRIFSLYPSDYSLSWLYKNQINANAGGK